MNSGHFEVAIVGAGVAGLAAASVLGRSGRRAVVLGLPDRENADAVEVHNLPIAEGMPPSALYASMESELVRWNIPLIPQLVVTAAVDRERRRVNLVTADGSLEADRVLLATGVSQQVPAWVPDGTWGRSVFLCPFCHAYEHRGQDFVIVGPPVPMTLEVALLCTPHARTLTVVVPALEPVSGPLADRIRALGGRVLADEIVAAEVDQAGALVLGTTGGQRFTVGAVIPFGITRMRSELSSQLELRANHVGIPEIDDDGRSSDPLIWVAGTAAKPHHVLAEAMGSGIRAAMSIHKSLVLEGLT